QLQGRSPGLFSSPCPPPHPQSPYRCTQKLPPSGHFSRLAAGPQLFPVLIKTKMIT
ncbi:mCG145875, partial [Mus musculus]